MYLDRTGAHLMNMKHITAIALNLLVAVAAVLAYALPAMTHEAPELWPSVSTVTEERVAADRAKMPVNVPTWERSDAATGCRVITGKEEPYSFDHLLVVHNDASRVEMSYSEGLRRSRLDGAGKVWIVGVC